MARCPICDVEAKPRAENKLFPFCSPRCKTIDLGKWLNEDYRVAQDENGESADDADLSDEEAHASKKDVRH